jgi:hypothetical protein
VFTALLGELDPLAGPSAPIGTGVGDAADAIGRLGAAARRRLGATTTVVGGWSPWQLASAVTAGHLLGGSRLRGNAHRATGHRRN